MKTPNPPSSFTHYMPYVVVALVVGLAVVGTHFISRKAATAVQVKPETLEKKPKTPPSTPEPVLGYELPGKSYIGTIGKEKGLKATIFGRESDLLKVVNNKSSRLTLDVPSGDPFAAMKPSDSSLPTSVAAGHVLIVISNLKQFLKLVAEARKPISQESSQLEIGRLSVDSQGAVEVVIDTSDGVELDAAPFDKLQMSFPDGALRVSAPS